jgi:glucokinase
MRTALGLARVVAINDFHALALAVDRLAEADFAPVKSGAPVADAPVLVLGPGTGFGQALIVPCGDRRRIVTTEGGHVGFAPHTEDEIAVMRVIAGAHGRASVERLLSGAGLANVHRALRAISKSPTGDLAPEDVTAAARAGADPIATQALAMFCAVLGAVAGDAVLATGARGGVVLGGGILPRIRDILSQSAFTERFLAKGRMRGYVENVPARLILRDGAALLGAAAALAGAAPD